MKAADVVLLIVLGGGAYFLLRRLANQPAPARSFYAGGSSAPVPARKSSSPFNQALASWFNTGATDASLYRRQVTEDIDDRDLRGVTDYSAPGNSRFNAPPPGFIWNEPAGGYIFRNETGETTGIYV